MGLEIKRVNIKFWQVCIIAFAAGLLIGMAQDVASKIFQSSKSYPVLPYKDKDDHSHN
jgi:hypothetical protein